MNLPALPHPAFRKFESLLACGQTERALDVLDEIILSDPANRELQLYALLQKINVFGPERYEAEIDRIRSLDNLTDAERCTVSAIFERGYDAALITGDQVHAAAYRRCLQQLADCQSMQQSVLPLSFGSRVNHELEIAPLTANELVIIRRIFSLGERVPSKKERIMHLCSRLLAVIPTIKWDAYAEHFRPVMERLSSPVQRAWTKKESVTHWCARLLEGMAANKCETYTEHLQLTVKRISSLRKGAWSEKERVIGLSSRLLSMIPANKWKVYAVQVRHLIRQSVISAGQLLTALAKVLALPRYVYSAVLLALFGGFLWLLNVHRGGEVRPPRSAVNSAPASPIVGKESRFQDKAPEPVPVSVAVNPAPSVQQANTPTVFDQDQGGQSKPVQVRKQRRPTKMVVAEEEEPKPEPPTSVLVRARPVKARQAVGLREEPSYSAPKGVSLEPGTKLVMIERAGSWVKVRNEATGSTGYVREEFVTSVAAQQ